MGEGYVALPVARTDGKKGKSGKCIVVPQVSSNVWQLVEGNEVGKAWLIAQINGLRSEIASGLNKAGKEISSDKLGIDGILAAMKASNESTRLTKESIGVWFDTYLVPVLTEKLLEKFTGIATAKLEAIVEGYKVEFCKCTSRELVIVPAVKEQLNKALALLPEDHDTAICEKLIVLIEGAATESKVDLNAL
jgi:hypothetical protein